MKKIFNIRLDEKIKEKLKKKAEQNGTTITGEIKQAIIKHLKR